MATLAQTAKAVPTHAWTRVPLWPLAALVLLGVAALSTGWLGFIASDDVSYYLGAEQWLRDPPFAGTDHWTTRFPLLLSLAAAIGLLGGGLAPLAVTAILWYVAFVAAGTVLARRIGGARAGWIAAVLIATMPLVATAGSVVNCDLPEIFFLTLGLLLLADPHGRTSRALLAGLSFGAAILCRETAVLALAGLGFLFIAGRPLPRRTLILAGLGCAGLLAAEMLFQLAVTGDPLHRYTLAFNHDSTLSRADNLEGNLLVHPLLDPFVVLLVNNEFGLLFPLAAAALFGNAARALAPDRRRPLLILSVMAATSFVAVALLGSKLVLNPRYFTLAALTAAILAALWISRLDARRRALLLAGAVASNLLLLSAQNAHPYWSAEALVAAARAHPGQTILADPPTLHRAELPLRWHQLSNVGIAGHGNGLLLVAESAAPSGSRPIARFPSPPTPLGALLLASGLDGPLPAAIRDRLVSPSQGMVLLSSEPRAR